MTGPGERVLSNVSTSRQQKVLVEGFGADSVACVAFLSDKGAVVTIAGPGVPSTDAAALSRLGVEVIGHCDLDATSLTRDVFVVDCWTSERAARVIRHREAGSRLTSIGDLVLASSVVPTIGVTGTGGKTTATRLVAAALRAGGLTVGESHSARAGNAWPSAELLEPMPHADWLAVELTSTHLAYMHETPTIAVITSFWPDHVELHGSLENYRHAKARILGGEEQLVVINGDDAGAAGFAEVARGRVVCASANGPVETGVGVEGGKMVLRDEGLLVPLGPRHALPFDGPLAGVAVTALVAAIWAGADPLLAASALQVPLELPHRRRTLGTVGGVEMVDDTAATTPRKMVASLFGRELARVVMIVGGASTLGTQAVLNAPEERYELEQALSHLTGCRAVVAFGEAGTRIDGASACVETFAQACAAARRLARAGDTVIVSPMFPVDMEDRNRLPVLLGIEDD